VVCIVWSDDAAALIVDATLVACCTNTDRVPGSPGSLATESHADQKLESCEAIPESARLTEYVFDALERRVALLKARERRVLQRILDLHEFVAEALDRGDLHALAVTGRGGEQCRNVAAERRQAREPPASSRRVLAFAMLLEAISSARC